MIRQILDEKLCKCIELHATISLSNFDNICSVVSEKADVDGFDDIVVDFSNEIFCWEYPTASMLCNYWKVHHSGNKGSAVSKYTQVHWMVASQ